MQFDRSDYDLEDEYAPSQMAALPKGRYDHKPRGGKQSSGHAIDLSSLSRNLAESVKDDRQVLLVYLFGSQVRGATGALSDLDLAVLLTHTAPVAHLRSELAGAFLALAQGIPVDLVILNEAPIELANSVITEGRVLYERSLADRVEYEADVMSRYGDYLPFLRAQQKDILEGVGNDRRVQRYRKALGRTERTLGALGTAKGTAAR